MTATQLGAAFIRRCLPHGAAMCLLDEVLHWDSEHVVCRASDARRPDHPLRRDAMLHAVNAVEYAAQAAAVHGALAQPGGGDRAGVIASVRGLHWRRQALDAGTWLEVRCELELAQASAVAYRFWLTDDQGAIAEGRVTVVFPETVA